MAATTARQHDANADEDEKNWPTNDDGQKPDLTGDGHVRHHWRTRIGHACVLSDADVSRLGALVVVVAADVDLVRLSLNAVVVVGDASGDGGNVT